MNNIIICTTDLEGNRFWSVDGNFHRDEAPAIEWADGTKEWYLNGKLHRLDGPAYESKNNKQWCINGILHREDGPALEYCNGDKEWWINGKLHRIDGPAIDHGCWGCMWYYQGENINCSSQKEFEKIIKLKLFW